MLISQLLLSNFHIFCLFQNHLLLIIEETLVNDLLCLFKNSITHTALC